MKVCSLCAHSERASIDACLVSGSSLRDVAGQFDLSRSAVDRHKRHIPRHLTLARDAEEAAQSTTLLSRVERIMSRCEGLATKAEQRGNWGGAVAAIREIRGCLELIGKLSGELVLRGGTGATKLGLSGKGAIVGSGQVFELDALSDVQLSHLLQSFQAHQSDQEAPAPQLGYVIENTSVNLLEV